MRYSLKFNGVGNKKELYYNLMGSVTKKNYIVNDYHLSPTPFTQSQEQSRCDGRLYYFGYRTAARTDATNHR